MASKEPPSIRILSNEPKNNKEAKNQHPISKLYLYQNSSTSSGISSHPLSALQLCRIISSSTLITPKTLIIGYDKLKGEYVDPSLDSSATKDNGESCWRECRSLEFLSVCFRRWHYES